MKSQQLLVNALYTAIKDSIGSLIGNRVYENLAKQDCSLPCAVFSIVADTPDPFFVRDGLDADFQVTIFGWKRLRSKAIRTISDILLEDLHRAEIELDGYDYNFVDVSIRGITTVEDETISIRSQYNIRAAEEVNIS